MSKFDVFLLAGVFIITPHLSNIQAMWTAGVFAILAFVCLIVEVE